MSIRWQTFQKSDLEAIHHATLKVFENTGIRFHEPGALEIFKEHGVRVDGDIVFIDEKTVEKALETVPSKFTLEARNPGNIVVFDIDENTLVVSPTLGPVFVADESGNLRSPTMDDYNKICKLAQTSDYIDMNGISMVTPTEVPKDQSHLDLLLLNIIFCDKAFMGGAFTRRAAVDSREMAGILWEGKDSLLNKPVMVCNLSALSPLQWSKEMVGALIDYARCGPLSFTQVNAEILSGIVLAQLINPGVPVIYSSSSGPMDMRTGALSSTGPEITVIKTWVNQMAHFYRAPSRTLGATSDAHCLDYQARIESACTLLSSVTGGTNFILQSFGMLSTGLSLSYEKFIIDEEYFGMLFRALRTVEINPESINLSLIEEVGIGGEYLAHANTFELCGSEFFIPGIMRIQNHGEWEKSGKKRVEERAREAL